MTGIPLRPIYSSSRRASGRVHCSRHQILLGLTDVLLRLLESAQVVVRGPKPTAVLHSRKARIDRAASNPFTTHEVLAEMRKTPLRGKRVVVQRYGETNRELQAALGNRGKFPGERRWIYAGAGRMRLARGGIFGPGMPRRAPMNS